MSGFALRYVMFFLLDFFFGELLKMESPFETHTHLTVLPAQLPRSQLASAALPAASAFLVC